MLPRGEPAVPSSARSHAAVLQLVLRLWLILVLRPEALQAIPQLLCE